MPGPDAWAGFPLANSKPPAKQPRQPEQHDWSSFPEASAAPSVKPGKPSLPVVSGPPLSSDPITGAVDGDTLTMGSGRHLRLWGVDAPELKQPGFDRQGNPVPIGQASRNALLGYLSNGSKPVAEQYVSQSYGRPVAPVTVGGDDLGQTLARSGNALAAPEFLSSDPERRFQYLQAERLARVNGLGVHATRFQPPEQFRRDPAMVDMPQREVTPLWWDTPTPNPGMRPEVERRFVEMMNDPSISEGAVANYAKDNGGFLVDPVELKRNRDYAKRTGQKIGLGYQDAPVGMTDTGSGVKGALTRGFANGVLPDLAEEVEAIGDTLGGTQGRENIWNSDRRLADIWANNAYQNEAITNYDESAHPWATTTGKIGGGLLDAYLFPVGRAGWSVGNLAKFGAGYGFAGGFGQPGTLPQRLTSGVVGMGEGLATNVLGGKLVDAAAPYLAKGLSAAGERLSPALDRFKVKPADAVSVADIAPGRGAVPMSADAGQAISQDVPAARPRPLDAPLTEAQIKAASESVTPGDVLPIPANQVGSVEEAIAKDAGRFAEAKAPNERDQLERQTVRAWNGAEVPKVGPIDLVGWLRLRGGLKDQSGELSHMGFTNAPRKGMDFVGQEHRFGPLVNNESGMTLDDAAHAAWERGYFPDLAERPTTAEFLDRLRSTHDGGQRDFLPEDLAQIERYNSAQQERYVLEQQRFETGQPVYVDKSAPATEPAPLPPVEAYQEWPAGGPDFAGNINLNKLESPQDIKRALDFTDRRVAFDAATRGRVSQAETERLASELGMTPERLLARRKGQAMNAEEALAARQILAKSGNELVNAARKLRQAGDEPGSELLGEFRQKWMRHVAIQEQVAGATAEAGRALAQFKMLANSRAVRGDVLSSMVDAAGGKGRMQDAADVLLDAIETDPGKFNVLAEQLAKPRFKDKAIELYYNMMLSGPATHVVNVTSNTLTALGQIPEHASAAVLGKGREMFAKGAVDRVTSSEVGRRAFGLLQGFKEGLGAFARTARTGETSDLISKVEAQGQKAISGVKGEVIRTPSRLLSAEDELFKAVARRMEINGEAARIAHKEGLKGDAAAKRIAELVANPTDDMIARSMDYGRYLTFQRPLGDIAGGVARMRNDSLLMTMLVPFVRTPTNILKFAAERSPAAPLLKEWRADFKAGGARRDLAIARVLVGTGFAAAIYEAALDGRVSGSTPSDEAKARFMKADGWQPYSFKIGDKWYSYNRLDPFATTIGVAADLATKKDGMTKKQLDDYAMLLTASILKNMGDKTWLSSASDFVQALSDPERYGPSYLRKMAAGLVTPAISSQVARAVDPVARDTQTVGDAIINRIPGLSTSLPAKRDIWGKAIVNEGGVGPDFMSPIWTSTAKNDPVNAEMLRIGARFQPPVRTIGKGENALRLDGKQYEGLSATAGQATRARIEALMASPDWAAMPDDAKAKFALKAATAAKAEARGQLSGAPPIKSADPWAAFPSAEKKAAPDKWSRFGKPENPDIAGDLQRAIPGIGLSSGYRTKEYQADMRRRGYKPADDSAHLDGSSLDLTPPPGKSMDWLRGQVRKLYPQARFLNEGDHLHTTFPGWFGAPVLGGAKAWGIVNPNSGR